MEKKMENEMETLGPFKGVYRDITAIMENQMERKMENEMETGIIRYFIFKSLNILNRHQRHTPHWLLARVRRVLFRYWG